jgi:mannose-1-phosphate guanylyltransferase
METMLHAVIMAGGAGTRFWPASRADLPKQLLALDSDRTMIQATYDRIRGLVPPAKTMVVTNQALTKTVAEQLPELPPRSVIGEPCKRDTAPCIGLSAGIIARDDPDAVIVVMPADHVIRPTERFLADVRRAVRLVDSDPRRIITFGIRPTFPAETYGYIERGDRVSEEDGVYQVRMFREKPSAEKARQYLDSGLFYWNSGIFVWRARTIWDALCRFEPEMGQHLAPIVSAYGSPAFNAVFPDEFERIRGKSIDFAVMEKYQPVAVIEASFEWDDLGSWCSLARLRGSDHSGNTVIGRHLGIDTRGCIVRGDDQHLVVTMGMEDCIVVHTSDATLVARKQDEESIRKVVEQLRQRGWKEYL